MFEYYPQIKHLHMSLAMLSVLGFLFRWVLMLLGAAWANAKLLRIAPHIIDTLLLVAAILLCIMLSQYPWNQPWIAAKLAYLLGYIGLGTFALRRAPNQAVRLFCGVAAVLVFAQIFATALSRNPLGLLAG